MTTSGWVVSPSTPPASRRRWLYGCGAFILLSIAVVVLVATVAFRALGNGEAVISASHGQIDTFRASRAASGWAVVFQAARGIDVADGHRLACQVVRPTLATTDWASASWTIVNRAGDLIASNRTACP